MPWLLVVMRGVLHRRRQCSRKFPCQTLIRRSLFATFPISPLSANFYLSDYHQISPCSFVLLGRAIFSLVDFSQRRQQGQSTRRDRRAGWCDGDCDGKLLRPTQCPIQQVEQCPPKTQAEQRGVRW